MCQVHSRAARSSQDMTSRWSASGHDKLTKSVVMLAIVLVGKSSTFNHPFIKLPSSSSFNWWCIVCHLPDPGILLMRLRGEVWKCPLKIICAWETDNGLDILIAANLAYISLSMIWGKLRVEMRFPGMKVCHNGGSCWLENWKICHWLEMGNGKSCPKHPGCGTSPLLCME